MQRLFRGDIAGITKKLDYLKGLGVTAIYVNPIYDASSNHRYDAVDYGTIDPFLGNFKDLEKLSAEMQKRGMHLIMDGVYNHIGDDSIYFDRYGKYKIRVLEPHLRPHERQAHDGGGGQGRGQERTRGRRPGLQPVALGELVRHPQREDTGHDGQEVRLP
ncbi:alpha-amylase family glycosyl hydrolase [Mitsuokella jalaludinii]|uniref:alpha-amylase family glycosyl hydrolase n=1 Tax=Mitsuokella jalaludinii TaxID=187979 RepID=UPI00307A45D4